MTVSYELGKWLLLLIIVGLLLNYFVLTVFVVDGLSMEPNYHNGEVVLASRTNLFTNKFKRGDVLVLRFPGDPKRKKYIKRLIALPQDRVEIKEGKVYVNGKRLTEGYLPKGQKTYPNLKITVLGEDEYFLLGDNRDNSSDSRVWGEASRKDLIGPVRFLAWPLDRWEFVVPPVY